MDRFTNWLARRLLPGYLGPSEVESRVSAAVKTAVTVARQALPINLDYDPKNEGYRRWTADEQAWHMRDLTPLSQDMMLELAYYLYDTSGLVKRFARDTKNFVLGEGLEYKVENDPQGKAREVIDRFWDDSVNQMNLRLGKKVEFLGLLGEQCWPVWVNPYDGSVRLSYVDPVNIDVVETSLNFPEMAASVRLKGITGRSGQILSVIREEWDPRKREHGRLAGDCFYFAVNNPPNGTRGRSDLIASFDFISAFEEAIFDEIDRLRFIKAFIWDVELQGATEEDVREFLRKNKTPKPGSVRAHNERVKWEAVAPDLKMHDSQAFLSFLKSYLAATQNRPDSWFGSGGKAYQTEAALMGEPTFKDLGDRQRYVKYMVEYVLRFVLDQAVLHGVLSEPSGARYKVQVSMPEMVIKDLKSIVDGLFQLAQALMIAETQQWVSTGTATTVFASVAKRVGVEIDAAEEIEKAAKEGFDAGGGVVTKDYAAREAIVDEIVARFERKGAAARAGSEAS